MAPNANTVTVRDRYYVNSPEEAYANTGTRLEDAIDIAKERATPWQGTCRWDASVVNGATVKVIRQRKVVRQ